MHYFGLGWHYFYSIFRINTDQTLDLHFFTSEDLQTQS
jgi:hypothetical protein